MWDKDLMGGRGETEDVWGFACPHEGSMKAIRTGAVLPDGVWHGGKIAMTMSPGYG